MPITPQTPSTLPILLIRFGAGIGIIALIALIVISALQMSLMDGLRATMDTTWGITTMVDLVLGLVAVGAWIAHRERRLARTLLWLIALCLLGNLTTLMYVLLASWNARSMHELFHPRSS